MDWLSGQLGERESLCEIRSRDRETPVAISVSEGLCRIADRRPINAWTRGGNSWQPRRCSSTSRRSASPVVRPDTPRHAPARLRNPGRVRKRPSPFRVGAPTSWDRSSASTCSAARGRAGMRDLSKSGRPAGLTRERRSEARHCDRWVDVCGGIFRATSLRGIVT